MKHLLTLLITFLISSHALAQVSVTVSTKAKAEVKDSLYLNIVIPETDTVLYPYSRYRLAANTHPNAKAYINRSEVKVYENGAFVDRIDHEDDTTAIHFKVVMNGDSLMKTMYLIKPKAPDAINPKGKVITTRSMRPGSDLWLMTGEILKVQFMGTPGEEVVFNIDGFKRNIPMRELPEEVAGVEGLYVGEYEVKPGDRIENRYITFKMRRNFLSFKKRKSAHTVTFMNEPRVAEVTSESAYLNIGMGEDRLGGARYGDIEEEVMLKITGKKNNNYKVQLSKSLTAWIPEDFVELRNTHQVQAKSLTGNIKVNSIGNRDQIVLTLSEKLPYISYQELDPNKIIVDVFGATSNTNWKIKYQSSDGIANVDWRQVEDDLFRLIITLKSDLNWGYEVGYGWGAQLVVKVKRPPVLASESRPLQGRVISVDAGHGGDNNGSLGASGYMEKEINLEITNKLKEQLEAKGARVVMPRTDDTYVYMSERKEQTLKGGADLLLSIHANSIGYSTDPMAIRGTGAFYKHLAFRPLAAMIYEKMTDLGFEDYGLTGNFNFALNAATEYPNVLVETGFITHPEEELNLTDPEFQDKIAMAITEALETFYLRYGILKSEGN